MWNEHLREVIDELVTTIKEMNPNKQACVLTLVKEKMAAMQSLDDQCTLTSPIHEWILPPGDPQRVARTPPPEQRVTQRVGKDAPATPVITPLTCITNAPALMAAPNPTTKRALKLTPWSHVRQTWSNIPGSVPPITRSNQRPVTVKPLPPTPAPTRRMGARSRPRSTPVVPTRLPHVRFVPINGGLQRHNMISQEAINFLSECVWANSPDIFKPSKLHPTAAPTCLDLKQVAMPMVHPTTGDTISSYKKLMHDVATTETWQTAFGKDFGGMVQGNNKTGQKREEFNIRYDSLRDPPLEYT
jgi:hypothetical protein